MFCTYCDFSPNSDTNQNWVPTWPLWMDQSLEAASPTLKTAAAQRKLAHQAYAVVSRNARSAKRAMQSAGNGSHRRPRLVDASAFDPDA
jgi:hypothetical protein